MQLLPPICHPHSCITSSSTSCSRARAHSSLHTTISRRTWAARALLTPKMAALHPTNSRCRGANNHRVSPWAELHKPHRNRARRRQRTPQEATNPLVACRVHRLSTSVRIWTSRYNRYILMQRVELAVSTGIRARQRNEDDFLIRFYDWMTRTEIKLDKCLNI